MRKLLALAGAFVIGATLTAQAAGVVYTIPADYEKIKKAVEGLMGKSTSDVDLTQAQNYGANVRAFIEGATGKSVSSTYSPTYFKAYGNNYRQFVKSATATDPGATTSSTNFERAGNNYRNLAQGMTGLGITDSRYYYYNYAGRNVRNLAEGQTGLTIGDSRYYYFRNAGRNVKTVTETFGDGHSVISWDNNLFKYSQFKRRADQTYYDMYLNDNALKKSFKLAFDPNSLASGLTPITRDNEADSGGSDILPVVAKPVGYNTIEKCTKWWNGSCYSSEEVAEANYLYVKDGYSATIRFVRYGVNPYMNNYRVEIKDKSGNIVFSKIICYEAVGKVYISKVFSVPGGKVYKIITPPSVFIRIDGMITDYYSPFSEGYYVVGNNLVEGKW